MTDTMNAASEKATEVKNTATEGGAARKYVGDDRCHRRSCVPITDRAAPDR